MSEGRGGGVSGMDKATPLSVQEWPDPHRRAACFKDMLAALKKITNNWSDLHPKDYQQAMAAIRKAEGASP